MYYKVIFLTRLGIITNIFNLKFLFLSLLYTGIYNTVKLRVLIMIEWNKIVFQNKNSNPISLHYNILVSMLHAIRQ